MYKLSISNIGWEEKNDIYIFEWMQKYGFSGLEIAPTRIFPEAPYEKIKEAKTLAEDLKKQFGFAISSMQSIWYGRREMIFGSDQERQILIDCTEKAINFASAIECRNLVFGCPGNRNMPGNADEEIAIGFFREIGDYAASKGTVIGMEANPPIYNTNFINHTLTAFELIEKVDSNGFLLNLDTGTMIQNNEMISELMGKVHLINHVHISEPGLKPIEDRELHKSLKQILEAEGYQGFVSIEMGKVDDIRVIDEKLNYVRGVFA